MTACESSLISAFSYDDNAEMLTVVFRTNNEVRHYTGFPPELFWEFEESESKGKFFNARIKAKFEVLKSGRVSDEQLRVAVTTTVVEMPTEAQFEESLGITDEDIQSADPEHVIVAKPEILSPDQAVAVLAPKSPQADRLTAELHRMAAIKIDVKDKPSQVQMEDHLVAMTQVRKAVFDLIDPYRAIAYSAYESVQKLNKARLDPADAAIKAGKQILGTYITAEEEKASKEQKRLQDIADANAILEQQRATEELRLQVAQQHVESGDTAQAEIALFSEEIQAPMMPTYAPRVEAPVSTLGGRSNWKGEILNMEDVILDVAEGIKSLRAGKNLAGHAPMGVLQACDSGIKALANSNKTMFRYPGMRAWDDRVITTTKKKGQ